MTLKEIIDEEKKLIEKDENYSGSYIIRLLNLILKRVKWEEDGK